LITPIVMLGCLGNRSTKILCIAYPPERLGYGPTARLLIVCTSLRIPMIFSSGNLLRRISPVSSLEGKRTLPHDEGIPGAKVTSNVATGPAKDKFRLKVHMWLV